MSQGTGKTPSAESPPTAHLVGSDRVLAVLTELAGRPIGIGLDELARTLDSPKPTVHRALAALRRAGFATQNGRGHYLLGDEFIRLAFSNHEARPDHLRVQPILAELAARHGETAHFAVLDGYSVVYRSKVDPPAGAAKLTSTVGGRNPAHSTAVGKLLLSYCLLDDADVAAWVSGAGESGLAARTDRTRTTAESLAEELATIRSQGYATDDQENEPGVNCLALPVFLASPSIPSGAVSLSALTYRTPLAVLVEDLPRIRAIVGGRTAAEDPGDNQAVSVRTYRAQVAARPVHVLAEGPVWDAARERILWVDVNAKRVHEGTLVHGRVVPGPHVQFDQTIGAVVCSTGGDLLVAGARSLLTIRVDGTRIIGPQLIPAERASRLNDGTCDPAGRFLVGGLALDGRTGQEELVVVDTGPSDGGPPDRGPANAAPVLVLDSDLTLSNGLAFSPDGGRLYSIDTVPRCIWVRDHDARTGTFGPRRKHLTVAGGHPDGMCADAEGNLWVAIWGAGQIRCYSPAGQVLATVEVAAPNTSSVAFVGPELDTLLITTASEQLSPLQLTEYPDSGRLFTASVGVTGLPVPAWAGPGIPPPSR